MIAPVPSSITEINVPRSIICGDGAFGGVGRWDETGDAAAATPLCIASRRFTDYNMPLNCLEMRNSFLSYNWIRAIFYRAEPPFHLEGNVSTHWGRTTEAVFGVSFKTL